MPLVKVELVKRNNKQVIVQIRDLVMDAVVEVLQLPADDRNIRVIEYEPEYFQMKPPYEMLIEIAMFSGRSKEAKKKLFQTILNNLISKELIAKEKVFILLNEQPMENWGVKGGIPADEINLGFKVNI
jgi:phenylpyruvate tautomerase PptA (4-oxalocrotonate tautomerase family)